MNTTNTQAKNTPKLRFSGFSGEWISKRIDEFAPLQRGFDLPVLKIKKGKYPVVFSNGVLSTHNAYKAKAPGVVTGRSGTIGKVHYIQKDYWPHNTSLWVTNFKGNNPKYVFYVYNSFNLKRFGTGSGVPTLNRNDIHSEKIAVPNLKEQQKIAGFLTTVDERIEGVAKKVELLKKYKKGVMKKIFSQEIRFKDEDGKEFPEWGVTKLDNYVSLEHGDGDWILSEDLDKNGQYKIVQLGNIGFGEYLEKDLRTISEEKFIELKGTPIKKGDLLINRMVDEGINCCLFKKRGDYVTSVDVCWIRKNTYFNNYFLMSLLLTSRSQKKLLSISSGSGRVRISKKNLFSEFKFLMPSLLEQEKVADCLQLIDKKIELEERKLAEAKKFKKSLLQQMFV